MDGGALGGKRIAGVAVFLVALAILLPNLPGPVDEARDGSDTTAEGDVQPRRAGPPIFDSSEYPDLSGLLSRQAPFQDVFTSRPVGVGAGGRIVFRDGLGRFGRFGEGRIWDPAWYVAVDEGGALQRIAEAKGEEMYYGQHQSDAVTMGHRTFEAATEDHLIIADTDRGAIAVLDWSGSEVVEIPMPAGVRLSAAQVQEGREWRVSQEQRFMAWVRRAVASGQLPEMAEGLDDAEVAKAYADWPVNEVAPAIDTLLTDFDARLWVRDYRLSDQDSVTWRVWDVDPPHALFTVKMDEGARLLDAHRDLLLLRRVNALDVPRAEVRRLVGLPD